MKASLITAGALVCTLATLARAQHPTQIDKPMDPKAAALLKRKLAAQNDSPIVSAQPAGSGSSSLASGSDTCTTPTPISGAGPFSFDTSTATTGAEGQANAICLNAGQTGIANDTWYAWTSGFTGTAIVSFCGTSTGDSKVAIYNGSGCPGAAAIACNDDFCPGFVSQLTFPATNATVYTIQVGKFPGTASVPSGTFSITLQPPPAGNDACAAAIAISGPGPHAFNTIGATTDGPSNCGTFTNDVWFNWTAGASGPYEVSLCAGGVTYDSEVAIYDSTACVGALLACDDDFCAFAGPSKAVFTAVGGSVYKIQVGGFNGSSGTGNFTIGPPPPPPPNDDCSTPTAISGSGPFAFDTTAASTGSQGQAEALCLAYTTTGIDNDAWFTWTAGATGQASLTTCGSTGVDTKIAVYPGAGCPSASAIACNDDACLPNYQSTVCFNVTNGQNYTIQLGTYPGATNGSGTFGISVQGGGGNACQIDDGTSEDILGYIAGGELAWIQRFGPASGSTSLTNVQISWGSLAAPGNSPGNGTPSHVLLYDDPNDDGDPTDAVLVQNINTTVTNVDTDTFNTYAVTPVSLSGYFFVGAGLAHSSGQLVAPMDTSCIQPLSYLFGNNTGGAVNYTTPSANPDPPQSFASVGFACNLMVRAGCSSSPMAQFCFPGTGGVINCPCGQPANPSGGCANFGSGATSGAVLNATGVASLSADSVLLVATNERPGAITNVFWTGKTPPVAGGVGHGAGVRCVLQALKRLYTGQTVGGAITRPGMGDLSVSARTAAVSGGTPILPGETRLYFNLYRDNQAAGPCGNTASTVNLTNAGSMLWAP